MVVLSREDERRLSVCRVETQPAIDDDIAEQAASGHRRNVEVAGADRGPGCRVIIALEQQVNTVDATDEAGACDTEPRGKCQPDADVEVYVDVTSACIPSSERVAGGILDLSRNTIAEVGLPKVEDDVVDVLDAGIVGIFSDVG